MKKILIVSVLFTMIGMVHAAQLNWSFNSVMKSDGSGSRATGYVAYLFITEQSGSFGSTVTTVDAVKNLIESGAEFYTEEGKNYLKKGDDKIQIAASKTTNNGMISGASGYNGNNFQGGDSLTAFTVVFDAANVASAENYIITGTKSAAWTSGTGSQQVGFQNLSNATWTPVPEPSTAVLALAGLALLLKRRRA